MVPLTGLALLRQDFRHVVEGGGEHAAGYKEAQGYLIARPMPREATRRMLTAAFDEMPEVLPQQRQAG